MGGFGSGRPLQQASVDVLDIMKKLAVDGVGVFRIDGKRVQNIVHLYHIGKYSEARVPRGRRYRVFSYGAGRTLIVRAS